VDRRPTVQTTTTTQTNTQSAMLLQRRHSPATVKFPEISTFTICSTISSSLSQDTLMTKVHQCTQRIPRRTLRTYGRARTHGRTNMKTGTDLWWRMLKQQQCESKHQTQLLRTPTAASHHVHQTAHLPQSLA